MNIKKIFRSVAVKKIGDFALDLVIVFVIAMLVRTQIGSFFRVSGDSMTPNLRDRDLLLVDKLTYKWNDPERGDIVIVIPPNNPDIFYVKRVIGLPGEEMKFENGEVYVRSGVHSPWIKTEEAYLSDENRHRTCPQPYASAGECGNTLVHESKIIAIPAEHYFLLGDNRRHSSDSRSWLGTLSAADGAIERTAVVGRAILRLALTESFIPEAQAIRAPAYE